MMNTIISATKNANMLETMPIRLESRALESAPIQPIMWTRTPLRGCELKQSNGNARTRANRLWCTLPSTSRLMCATLIAWQCKLNLQTMTSIVSSVISLLSSVRPPVGTISLTTTPARHGLMMPT